MRPVFCGNFDLEARQYDQERLFSKYSPISRIDMKSGIGSSIVLSYFPLCTVLKFNVRGNF
jgi:RNA recognition motif-containing protein